MPKHEIHWVKDHTEICDRFDARVQLMKDYLDTKPADFEGIAVKRFLLHQAREQVSWYRQSIDALDYVGCVTCRRALETGQPFLEHYLPALQLPGHRARDGVSTRCYFPDIARTLDAMRS